MPDSPSIPATGWDGLPKRKPQALLVQVAKDRHGLRPAATPLTGYSRTYVFLAVELASLADHGDADLVLDIPKSDWR